jgi:hypothetical protein
MPTPRSRNFRNGFRGIGGRLNNYERSRGGLLRYRSRIPWWPSRKKPAAQGDMRQARWFVHRGGRCKNVAG